jgi:hypothetical protein
LPCFHPILDIPPIIPLVAASRSVISHLQNEDAITAGNILVSANQSIQIKMLKLLRPVRSFININRALLSPSKKASSPLS